MADAPHFAPIEVYLTVNGGLKAVAFYKKAFGAKTLFYQMADDRKRVLHATLSVFGGQIMLSDHFAEHSTDTAPPDKAGGASVTIHVNLDKPAKVNAAMAKAAKAGCTVTMKAQDTFWGMRYGRLKDPFGHVWSIGAPLPEKKGGRLS
jgi:PhnB protein